MHSDTKMNTLYESIYSSKLAKKKLLAVLLDPEKLVKSSLFLLADKIKRSPATHVFVGGSSYDGYDLDEIVSILKDALDLPIILFPGNSNQITNNADGMLFLNLLSGRNPDYLIENQIKAVPLLKDTAVEIIPTAYILIESGTETAVERVSQTKPMSRAAIDFVAQTAKAGEYMGNQLVYLEAGSGAKNAVPLEMIKKASEICSIPIIVGGGITTSAGIQDAFQHGATMVVIGTAFEKDADFFHRIKL